MDLSSASKRSSQLHRPKQARSVSLDDDDNLSNNSSSSFNILLTAASDSESQSPVSVRDMVKRYDTVAKLGTKGGARGEQPQQKQQQQEQQQQQPYGLPAMKSTYSSVNKFGTHTIPHRFPLRQYVAEMQENKGCKSMQTQQRNGMHNRNHENKKIGNIERSCKRNDYSFVAGKTAADGLDDCFMSDGENLYIADHTRRSSRSPIRNLNDVSSSLQTIPSAERSRAEVTDDIEEAHLQPTETSYQSKTTIAKTAGGVRIIIDIFFDQEHQPVSATDVIGSRVETDIPQSRILNEFQQQAAATQLTQN